jgi:hypothetical protein
LCVSCRRCNQLKGLLREDEFLGLREFLDGLHPAAKEDIERRLLGGGRVYAGRKAPAPSALSAATKETR